MKKEDNSELIEEAFRWRLFRAIEEARGALGDVPPDELQKKIDAAVDEVRARRYRERAERKQNDLAI
jgi:Ribbon-helix-helix domain